MPQTIAFPKRLTKRQAARRLGIPLNAVTRLIESGDLKTVPRLGNIQAIILESSVEELVPKLMGEEHNAG